MIEGADGTTITQINYDNGTVFTLDQSNTGEQKFVVPEGSFIYHAARRFALWEPNRDLNHSGGDIVKSIVVSSSDF
ncbi:hypothetical protein OH492_09175 [Vibrio chagasii]|nr:hypothetical protein [Vibrio chagasii]